MIGEIESDFRETGIPCPLCYGMTYSDGINRPQCGNNNCLELLPDEYIWQWLITLPKAQPIDKTTLILTCAECHTWTAMNHAATCSKICEDGNE